MHLVRDTVYRIVQLSICDRQVHSSSIDVSMSRYLLNSSQIDTVVIQIS